MASSFCSAGRRPAGTASSTRSTTSTRRRSRFRLPDICGPIRLSSIRIAPANDLDVLANDFQFNSRATCASHTYRGPRRITTSSDSEHGGTVTVADRRQARSLQAAGRLLWRRPVHLHRRRPHAGNGHGPCDSSRPRRPVPRRCRTATPNGLPVLVNDLFGADYAGAQQITAVSTPSAGGTAAVADDHRSIEYTPPAGFRRDGHLCLHGRRCARRPKCVSWSDSVARTQFPIFGSLEEYQQFLIDDALVRYEHLFGQPAWSGLLVCDDDFLAGGTPDTPDADRIIPRPMCRSRASTKAISSSSIPTTFTCSPTRNWSSSTPGRRQSCRSRPASRSKAGRSPNSCTAIDSRSFPTWGVGFYLSRSRGIDETSSGRRCRPIPASTIVTVLDVTDRTGAVDRADDVRWKGRYIDSRAVDDFVYLLVRNDNAVAPPPEVIDRGRRRTQNEPCRVRSTDPILAAWRGCLRDARGVPRANHRQPGRIRRRGAAELHRLRAGWPIGPHRPADTIPRRFFQPLVPDASNLISVVSFQVTGDEPGLASTSSVYGTRRQYRLCLAGELLRFRRRFVARRRGR